MRYCRREACGFAIVVLLCLSPLSWAEIYKWVDAQGNIHFGDKPLDSAQASQAEAVELKQSYQPTVRTAQEQEQFEREQWLQGKRTEMLRRDEQQAADQTQQKKQQLKEARCDALQNQLKALETVEVREDGKRVLTYLENEDGKSVSSAQQRGYIKELKAEIAQLRCA